MLKLSDEEIRERAADIRDFMNNPLFEGILGTLRNRYVQELVGTPPGTSHGTVLHAKLVALEDIRGEFHVGLNDEKFLLSKRKPG